MILNPFIIDRNFTRGLSDAGLLVATIALIFFVFCFAIYLIAEIRLFRNCGKPGWKAIIPFYSDYVFYCEICGLHWAWFVASLVCVVLSINNDVVKVLDVFINAMAFYNLALRINKDKIPAMIFGGIVPSILTTVYGFSNFYYDPSVEVKNSGLF